VDLNGEAVQIARLSVWIKTAERGKELTDLDGTIRAGNSIVDDPAFDPRALDWRSAFPAVFADGGFDVVVGNPPYVRQELLGEVKPYLGRRFAAYHGMADLYVYFFERGLELLRPGGRLSFIVTNKWMKAGYGAPLRRLFAERAWVEAVIDFGHAKQIFAEADVFPSIVVVAKPVAGEAPPDDEVEVSVIPRERLRIDDLQTQVDEEGFRLPRSRLGDEPWRLEPPEVQRLLDKIRERGVPLAEYAGVKPYYGIKTGCNEAFLIDTATRDRLVAEDPSSAKILKPYLRGQDVQRWVPAWDGFWMIFARRGIEIDRYPAVRAHLERFREKLEPKPGAWDEKRDGLWPGRKPGPYAWYEIQDTVAYWELLEGPKILYQEIQFHPAYALDQQGLFTNNKVFLLPTSDPYLTCSRSSTRLCSGGTTGASSPTSRTKRSTPRASGWSNCRSPSQAMTCGTRRRRSHRIS
jgi:hypothetical protein